MRKRLFAWVYGRIDRRTRQATARLRSDLLGDLIGDILEIGCGPGANFAHYRPEARVTATDYSEHMITRARTEATLPSVEASITVQQADIGALPFPDAAFDAVVSTLVLCSVPDQSRALAELHGLLRPGGELRLWEHVRSDRRWVAAAQAAANSIYSPLADGCHLNRNTAAAITAAGFEVLSQDRPTVRGHPLPNLLMIARLPDRASVDYGTAETLRGSEPTLDDRTKVSDRRPPG
jgi:ubiquinone/menaquinone biosynthesis C-methylase UbiE